MNGGVQIGSAYGEIKLDTSGVSQAVDRINRALGGLASGSRKQFAATGQAAEQGFKKVNSAAASFETSIGKINGALNRINPAVLLGMGAGLAAGIGLAVKSAVDMNATLETTRLQFETLIGSSAEAEAHVASLFDFAKKTPFETGPIIEASRMMRTFGGDVLDTRDNLELIGDAAAATNAPINELGFWVGRLYSNLQGGQPFGEAAMRLQELAVLSPAARQQMEALQKSGASAAEIFAVFQDDLGKFSGAMEKQAGTWSGLVSTIKDSLQLALAEGFEPFFEGAKAGLDTVVELFNSPEFTEGVREFAVNLGNMMAVVVPFVVEHGPALLKLIAALTVGLTGLLVTAKVAASIATLVKIISGVGALLSGTAAASTAAGAGMAAAGAGATAAAGGTGLLSGALALLTGPIGIAIAAVAALGVAWATNFGGIREKTAEAVDAIRAKVSAGLGTLRDLWASHGPGIEKAAGHLWAAIETRFQVGFENTQRIGRAGLAILHGDWEEAGRELGEAARAWIEGLRETFSHLADAIGPGLDAAARRIGEWWAGIDWEELGRQAVERLRNGLNQPINPGGSGKEGPLAALLGDPNEAGQRFRESFLAGFAAGGGDGGDGAWARWATAESERIAEQASRIFEDVTIDAAALDGAMADTAASITAVSDATGRAARGVTSYSVYLAMSGDGAKLAADHANKFADGLGQIEQQAGNAMRAMEAARLAQEQYTAAFGAVQGDYTSELPGGDKPLVTPEQTVSVTTGGLSAEDAELLATYRGEVEKLEAKVYDLTNGIGTYGTEQGKVNEAIAAAQGEIDHYRQLMEPLASVTGEVSTSQQGLKVNVEGVHQAIYAQLVQMGAAPEVVTAFAVATGIMSQAQMEAALQAAAVRVKIEELANQMAAGLPIDQALADLDTFINKIETGVNPATETMATGIPQRIVDMKEEMSGAALDAGEVVPEQITAGVNAGLDTVTAATEAIATAALAAAEDTWGGTGGGEAFDTGSTFTESAAAGVTDAQGDLVDSAGEAAEAATEEMHGVADSEGPVVGQAMVDGVVAGVEANRATLVEKMKEIAREAYQAAMDEIQAASPSRLFMNMGEAIITGITAGIDDTEETLYNKLADVANKLYDIGMGVFDIQSGGVSAQIEALDGQLSSGGDALAAAIEQIRPFITDAQMDNLLGMDPTRAAEVLRALRLKGIFQNNPEAARRLQAAVELADSQNTMLAERNRLEEEYLALQEEIAALEEARQQLDFLGYQMDLLNLITENGLDTSILDGLELGLDANMSDIVAAMTAAVRQLITATEDELDIHSPSGVFRDIGQNIMRGMALGIADNRSLDTVMRERFQGAQNMGLSLNPEQTVYIFGGYNPQVGRTGATADPLRDLFYQGL